jgi:hypothetical protein
MTIRDFLILAACLSCLGCRTADPSNPKGPASAGDPPAAGVHASGGNTVVYAYYFHQTFRCLSCQMTEEMTARAIEEHFAQPIQAGLVVWMPVNVDKPEGKALRQQFNAQATDLVLACVENGVCKESKKLDELAGLTDQPDAFSKYLVDQIGAYLSPVTSR